MLFAQWPLRPVGFLAFLADGDCEAAFEQRRQTYLLDAEQLRRDHGVENVTARAEACRSPQYAQIVVAGVKNQRLGSQSFEKAAQTQTCQRIDQVVRASDRELDQTNLFEIVVQTIGFGIHGDSCSAIDAIDQRRQDGAIPNVDKTFSLGSIQGSSSMRHLSSRKPDFQT